jgi:SOS response regulatory protein OraA/RecX
LNNREKVLRKLGRRSYSSYELILKLKSEMPEIKEITDEFLQKGYLNDEEWLTRFVQEEERKGRSPRATASRLYAKGVPREVIEEALGALDSDKAIREAVTKHLRRGSDKKKIMAALARLGFSWEAIHKILDDML